MSTRRVNKREQSAEPTFIKSGKVKDIYGFDEESSRSDELVFKFTNRISVFDKIIPTAVKHKGQVIAQISAHWLNECEKKGIRTDFIYMESPTEMVVERLRVVENPKTKDEPGRFIPLEFIARYYVAGSLLDRIKEGKISPESLGFQKGHVPKLGEKLPRPLFEATTKLEKTDRPLTDDEALEVGGITRETFDRIKAMTFEIDDMIQESVGRSGLVHADGKKEFGINREGEIVVVDTFGTPDEDRFWEADALQEGRLIEQSKEFVRQYYRSIGYYDALSAARKAGAEEPAIPALPDEISAKVTELYVALYERITGKKFVAPVEIRR